MTIDEIYIGQRVIWSYQQPGTVSGICHIKRPNEETKLIVIATLDEKGRSNNRFGDFTIRTVLGTPDKFSKLVE